jgi:hypothetical protein
VTPVDQTIVCNKRGDCQRAVVASLFDLELNQVPHFRLFPDNQWWSVYWYFLYALGYEMKGTAFAARRLADAPTINGFISAAVPSRTFEGCNHAVIINPQGLVVHDPNPNKRWLHVSVVQTGELIEFDLIEKRVDPECSDK